MVADACFVIHRNVDGRGKNVCFVVISNEIKGRMKILNFEVSNLSTKVVLVF